MEYLPYILAGLAAGLVVGAIGCYFYISPSTIAESSQRRSAPRMLIAQAEKRENIIKESELKAKDEFFKKREEFNREAEKTRNEQKDQERRLEKKEDLLEQQSEVLLKKEKHNQHTEKKLHERREHLEKNIKDAETLVEEETKKLHEITGMSRPEAEKLLLERLDHELADEVASRIQKNESKARERRAAAFWRPRFTATPPSTPRLRRPQVDIPPTSR